MKSTPAPAASSSRVVSAAFGLIRARNKIHSNVWPSPFLAVEPLQHKLARHKNMATTMKFYVGKTDKAERDAMQQAENRVKAEMDTKGVHAVQKS